MFQSSTFFDILHNDINHLITERIIKGRVPENADGLYNLEQKLLQLNGMRILFDKKHELEKYRNLKSASDVGTALP